MKNIWLINRFLDILLSNQINCTSDHESDFFVTLSVVPVAGLQRHLLVAGLKMLMC